MKKNSTLKLPKSRMNEYVETVVGDLTLTIPEVEEYDWLGRQVRRDGKMPLLWIPDTVAYLLSSPVADYLERVVQDVPKKWSPVTIPKTLFCQAGDVTSSMGKLKGYFVTASLPPVNSIFDYISPCTSVAEVNDTNDVIVITGAEFIDGKLVVHTGTDPQPADGIINDPDPADWVGGDLLVIVEASCVPTGGPVSNSNSVMQYTDKPWLTQCSVRSDMVTKGKAQFNRIKAVYNRVRLVVILFGEEALPTDLGNYSDEDAKTAYLNGVAAANDCTRQNMDAATTALAGIAEIKVHDIGQYPGTQDGEAERGTAVQIIVEDEIDQFTSA